MADADCWTIEANRRDKMFARRAIGTHERLRKIGTIAGQPASDRHSFADGADNARDELAAIDIEAIGKNENADKVGRRQRAADLLATCARAFRGRRRLAGDTQFGPIEANCGSRDLVVGDVAVVNLAAGATAKYVSAWKHRVEFAIAFAGRQRLSRSEEKDKVAAVVLVGMPEAEAQPVVSLQDS